MTGFTRIARIGLALAALGGNASARDWIDPPASLGRTAMAVPDASADEVAPDDEDMAAAELSARAGSADPAPADDAVAGSPRPYVDPPGRPAARPRG